MKNCGANGTRACPALGGSWVGSRNGELKPASCAA